MSTELQRRIIPAEELEVRSEQDGKKKKVSGYGIVYNRETHLWDDLYEVVRPGAATKILAKNPDIRCALNHDDMHIFGRTKSGTLVLEENKKGVKYTADPPDAQWARDAIASIERGDIDGSSFTFRVKEEKLTKRKNGTILREILEFERIGEMGPVVNPQYEETTAEARAKAEYESITADLRTQDNADEIAEIKRTLDLRRRRLDLKSKTGGLI